MQTHRKTNGRYIGLGMALAALLATAQPGIAQEELLPAVSNMIRHATSSSDASLPWSFDSGALHGDIQDLPIGVFDSGIGGLTVLEAILKLDAFDNSSLRPGSDGVPDFQNERFIYLGDQANMPYGNYAAAGREEFLHELILKDTAFLLGKRYWQSAAANAPSLDKPPVKAIVIACNTATAYGLSDIRRAVQAWDIPVVVVGVVEAGARGVLELQRDARTPPGCIAVLATVGTCSSMAYPKSIAGTLGRAGRRIPPTIQQGFAELAGAIEGDPAFLAQGNVTEFIRRDLTALVENYRQSGGGPPIDTVVLGCTHFPLVTEQIRATFRELRSAADPDGGSYRSLIAEELTVVDPAELTAKELFRELSAAKLRANPRESGLTPSPADLFFLSVPALPPASEHLAADGSLLAAYKYGREAGRLDIEDTRVVPLSTDMLPQSSLNLIRTSLPNVWQRIQPASNPQASRSE